MLFVGWCCWERLCIASTGGIKSALTQTCPGGRGMAALVSLVVLSSLILQLHDARLMNDSIYYLYDTMEKATSWS